MTASTTRWLGVLASLALVFTTSGCGAMPWAKPYDIQVIGNPSEEIISLFVIVASADQLGETESEEDLRRVLTSDKAKSYKVYAQYQSEDEPDTPWTPKRIENAVEQYITLWASEEDPNLKVSFKKKVIKQLGDHSALVIVSTTREGQSYFHHRVPFEDMALKGAKGVKLMVRETIIDPESIE